MRSIPDSQAIAMIAIMSLLTFFVRGLPFLLFSGKSKTPAYIMYLGKVLPYAIIGMLVVYCFKNICLQQGNILEAVNRYHRYAGGLLLQEYFPAAGTVRTARADRRHCHRSGTLLEEKHASLRWRRDTVLHVSCSDNF